MHHQMQTTSLWSSNNGFVACFLKTVDGVPGLVAFASISSDEKYFPSR